MPQRAGDEISLIDHSGADRPRVDLDEADHLGVVSRAQLEVGNPDLDVLQAQDAVAHCFSRFQVWNRRKRWLMTFS